MSRKSGGFYSFEWLITPQVITIIFPIGAIACIILGFKWLYFALTNQYGYENGLITGPLLILLGPLAWRLWCEVIIVIFFIHETLIEIRDRDNDASKNVRTIYLQRPADPAKVEALQQAMDE